jgi:CheY-like chemotaxis protein
MFVLPMRAEADQREVFLVAVTGWGQPQDRRKSRDAGFDRHIVKPITLAALEQLLRAAMQRAANSNRHAMHG